MRTSYRVCYDITASGRGLAGIMGLACLRAHVKEVPLDCEYGNRRAISEKQKAFAAD